MNTEANSFIALLLSEPTLLYPAREETTPADADRRARCDGQKHSCLRCGQRATVATVVTTTLGKRWLDLCLNCARWVRGE